MSIKLSLQERFAPRVPVRVIDRVPSGSPARLRLSLSAGHSEPVDTPEAARILAKRHLPLRTSLRIFSDLLAGAPNVVVLVPCVEDRDVLSAELACVGVMARLHEAAAIDAKRVREDRAMTQEEFALRYGLDLATLRNWEQGRSKPDAAARAILWTIAHRPDTVEQAIAESCS